MVVDFDVDGDGVITEAEVAMKERMLEIELREEKAESQKFMAWVAMGMMIIFTIFLFTPMLSDSRVNALADLLGLFYIAQTGVVAAYMGATAYMAGGEEAKALRHLAAAKRCKPPASSRWQCLRDMLARILPDSSD